MPQTRKSDPHGIDLSHSPSQRALIAARMCRTSKMVHTEAAAMFNVSPTILYCAFRVLDSGDKALIDAVERGSVRISGADRIAKGLSPKRCRPQVDVSQRERERLIALRARTGLTIHEHVHRALEMYLPTVEKKAP